MQRVWPTPHVAGVQVPVAATHKAAVAHAAPLLVQPLRLELQIWGWAPLQRDSPTLHVGVMQRWFAASQSAAVAHGVCVSFWPFALHV